MPRKNNKRVGEDGKTYIIPEEEEDDEIREEDLSDDEEARRRRRRRKNGEDVPARKKILSDEYAPNSIKKLRACVYCKLVLCTEQWRKNMMCPNCEDSRGLQDTTDCFESLISLILPRKSWVAEWQQMKDMIPGVYAMAISQSSEEPMGRGQDEEEMDEEDENEQSSFVEPLSSSKTSHFIQTKMEKGPKSSFKHEK